MTPTRRYPYSTATERGPCARPRLWARLRGRQLKGAKFRRQHPMLPYFGDFFCLASHSVVEVDGGQHGEAKNRRADEARTAYLQSQGCEEVLDNIDAVLERIAEFL